MISKYSVKRPYTVLVGVILVIVLGVVSLMRMTTDLLPDMSFQYALVITTDVGASPETVESEVTAPIEAAMATTSNIKGITSTSYNSYSLVVLEYEQNANMDSVVIEIQQELDQLEGSWSDSVGTPMIMQINPDMLPIMVAAVEKEGLSQSELSTYVENELIPSLESVEGVASVTASGEITESIEVTLNQEKIDALNDKIREEILSQFEDAQKELDDGKSEIEKGQNSISDTQEQLQDAATQVQEQKDSLLETEADLKAQREDLVSQQTSLQTILDGINDFMASDDYINLASLEEGIGQINEAIDQAIAAGATEDMVAEQRAEADGYQTQLDTANAAIAEQFSGLSELGITVNGYADLADAAGSVSELLAQVNTGIATIDTAQQQVEDGKTALNDAINELNTNTALAALQLGSTSAQLEAAAASMDDAQASLDSAKDSALDSADMDQILTVDMISSLLVAQNFNMPAGYAYDGAEEYLVRVGDSVESQEDLENLVLMDMGMDSVGIIRLSDVADIELVDDSAENYAIVNGNPGIMLSMEKQTGYSTGEVTDRLLDKFDSLEASTEGLNLAVLMNQGVYIDIIVESVVQNMIIGAILAVFILLLFLKDVKTTIIIACSIPLSVIVAVVLMYFTGISLNIISMSGLLLGIGMLVDNSIVVIENIYRLRGEGYSIRKAAVEGAGQVTGAIVASTLTTVSVYAPIIFTEGITRQLFVDLSLTVAFTLIASLVVALTFVPALSSSMLKKTKDIRHPWFDAFKNGYGKVLAVCLRFKPLVFLAVIVLLAGSAYLALSRGFTFMDMDIETDQLTVTIQPKEDETLTFEELTACSDEVIDRISDIEGIETIGAMAGGGTTSSLLGGSSDSVSMYILLDEDADVSVYDVSDEIVKRTADMDCDVSSNMSAMDFSTYFGSGLSVQIKGSDLDTLQILAAEVADILEQTEGTTDVEDGLDNVSSEFRITVDKEKAAEYGYTVAQVFQLVYAKTASSSSATTISTDIKDYEVYVQTEAQADTQLSDIKDLTFAYTNEDGEEEEIPLSDICTMEETTTLSKITRDAQNRYLTVSCGIDDDHNVTLVSDEVQKAINRMDIPEGYSITMEGEDETINEAMEQMLLMLLLAVIFIYLIMVAQFQSLLSPFIIMFTIPLAFTGGFLALYFCGMEVSIIAMLGFIMLAGLIVNNGIVLIDYINQARREGMNKKDAILDAGKTRLRPILMTALTTILAMSTSAAGLGDGSEMMRPMAVTIIGGLVYGTLLTLIVIPCIYDAFNREKSMVEEEL
jgi:HAE1 family hydrophobic/amphiphilic exporter-1